MKTFRHSEIWSFSFFKRNVSKSIILFLYLLIAFCLTFNFGQTFSNTTISNCNSWDTGNVFTAMKTVNVTIGGALDPSTVVLNQINIKLGNSSCKGNLSSYALRLVAPDGASTSIDISNQIASTISSIWIDMKFRDNSTLEKLNQHANTTQNTYYPHAIGYYKVETAGSFSNFNGIVPTGNWTLFIKENTSSEVSIEKFELIFGSPLNVDDQTAYSDNNDCATASCLDNTRPMMASNDNYSANDLQYPGNSPTALKPNGSTFTCEYNGANNNSAWIYFTPTASSLTLTLSGIMDQNTANGNSDTQPIVFTRSSGCSGALTVPSGGCPDDDDDNNDEYYVNNMSYANYTSANGGGSFLNGGGVTSDGGIYANGITDNFEFNLSNLTIGQIYYIYIDGNGGASSSFYIEGTTGMANCPNLLPVEIKSFSVINNCESNSIFWFTSSERENNFFILEKSGDGLNYDFIAEIVAAGHSSEPQYYSYEDKLDVKKDLYYYRISQVDFNGKRKILNTAVSKDLCIEKKVFYVENHILIRGFEHIDKIEIFDMLGRKILATNETMIDFNSFDSAFYNIVIYTENGIKSTYKIYKP